MLRRHVVSSGQSAAAGSSAAARGPRSTRGLTVDNREPDRAFALYRALFGIDELTQEKATIREPGFVHPKKYAKTSLISARLLNTVQLLLFTRSPPAPHTSVSQQWSGLETAVFSSW